METVDKRNSSIFGDFGFNMFAERCRSQHAEFLSLALALLVGFDGSYKEIVSEWRGLYFSSRVRVAMILLTINTAQLASIKTDKNNDEIQIT